MSRRGDDVHEMPRRRPIDDQAVESILGGSTTGDDLDGLRAFVVDVRAVAAGPMPAPSPELGHVLTRGFSTDQGDLPATAASNANGPAEQAAGLPKWRSARMKVSRYIAGLSIAAKVALGAGCVFAATATAGATGVLPGPVQDAVNAVTPFGGSDGSPGALPPSTTAPSDQHDGSTTGDGTSGSPGPGTGTGGGTVASGSTGSGDTPAPGHDAPAPTTVPTPAPTTVAPVVPPAPGGAPAGNPPVETPVAQSMEIHCSLNEGHTAVSCEWTTAPPAGFGSYVLLRTSDDGKPGRVLTQTGDITAHTWTDTLGLTPGVSYSYMVDSIGPDGKTTGHSNRVTITF